MKSNTVFFVILVCPFYWDWIVGVLDRSVVFFIRAIVGDIPIASQGNPKIPKYPLI
jgi:hypothetical protein